MAVSDRVAKTLTVQRIAALMACHEDRECSDPSMIHGDRWMDVIDRAIGARELQPVEDGKREKVGELWRDKRLLLKENVRGWLNDNGVADAKIHPDLLPLGEAPAKVEGQEKPSHLLAIAALLGLLKESGRPPYNQDATTKAAEKSERVPYSQDAIIQTIVEQDKDISGLSQGNLEKLFAKANGALKDARKGR